MNRTTWGIAFALLMSCPGLAPAAEPQPRLRLLVPAYFYPAGEGLKHWERLIAVSARVPVVAIVNPASGPGARADANYTRLLDRAKRQPGLTLLGYVSTRYARRPAAEVRADVDRWLRLYPQVHGIFFDEQASGADQAGYYAALYTHVRKERKLRLVVTNPGTICAEAYLAKPTADVACLFEGADGFGAWKPPAWAKKYGPRRFAALAYKVVGAEEMRNYVGAAAAKGVGWLYATDAAGANPWDRLPGYWEEEVAAVSKANGRKPR